MLDRLNVDRFLSDKPLAITLSGLEELRAHILARVSVFEANPQAFAAELRAAILQAQQPVAPPAQVTGVIQIRGTISQHSRGDLSSWLFGGSNCEDIAKQFREFMADENVSKIVLDIDSPGGSSYGIADLAAEIFAARGKKPIIAIANSVAASAAYWIGSQADYFYATEGAIAGSIGVYCMHQDVSGWAEKEGLSVTFISAGKYKTAGNQFEALDEATRSRIQARVDEVYDRFVADVARGRGASVSAVKAGYGEGDVLAAHQALAAGLIDGIQTLEDVIGGSFVSRDTTPAPEPADPEQVPPPEEDPGYPEDEGARRLARVQLTRFQAKAAAGAAA